MNRRHIKEKGFTLIELIFVIAIIVVLASIFVPLAMDKLGQTNRAKADSDLNTIANSLMASVTDLKRFPACNTADCDPFSGANNDLKLLVYKADTTDVVTTDIAAQSAACATVNWDAAANLEVAPSDPGRNNAFNHLIINNPNADATEAGAGTDYNGWKGPYLAKVGKDPWGNNYIAHIGAMEKGGTRVTATGRGWILSAGEDGVFNTCPDASTLGGDDLGFIFVTQ